MEPGIAVDGLSLRLGAFSLRGIDLAVQPGEVLAILGPNGAGKSVTLETIAGFHRPDAGRLSIGGRDVTELPPERRRVGFMFQNFGLFPHLNVAANVSFGLRARRGQHDSGAYRRDAAGLLGRFGIEHLADRAPQDLSPGEKQRVAMARALATEPDLFLFDEPFSALDARTHDALRDELKTFLHTSRIPAIFVTHDQTDASVLADRVAIMDRGEIVQAGSVADVFRAPVNAFVADFTGCENLLPGRLIGKVGEFWHVAIADQVIQARGGSVAGGVDSAVSMCIRAEDVALHAVDGIASCARAGDRVVNRLTMRVVEIIGFGAFCKVVLDGGFPLIAYLTKRGARDLALVPGGNAIAEIEAESIHLV